MASPQVENGYTKIANEVLEALVRADLSGQELRITLFVLRKTYGFNKKDDFISLSQMAKALGCLKVRCAQVVKNLESMKILTVNENINGVGKSFRFNKDFETWNTVNKNINRICFDKQGVNVFINYKRNNIQKKVYSPNSVELRTSELLFSLIRQRNPNFKQPDLQSWSKHIDLMLRIDKRSPEEIEKVIQWCQADAFWQNNILSTEKLRKQYDQLCLKMTNGNGKHVPQRHTGVVL